MTKPIFIVEKILHASRGRLLTEFKAYVDDDNQLVVVCKFHHPKEEGKPLE